jgi:uncharacterized membrane protein
VNIYRQVPLPFALATDLVAGLVYSTPCCGILPENTAMPPNDIETGIANGSRAYKSQEAGMPAPESSSRGAPSVLSAQPDAEDLSRDPDLRDVWNKWRGRPNKKTPVYSQPPQKGERHELEVFQNLVGIHFLRPGGGLLYPEDQGPKPASPIHDIFLPTKAAAKRWRNRGLYDRTLSQDLKNRVLYGMSNYIITFLYLLQILIAAALTGLSAYQETSSIALTTLGAINTVLAGILAWLNGQGMPVRFRRARDQYREVVRAIEDTERTFAEIDYVDWPPGTRPNPYAERDRLEQMYDEARQDHERNYPDIQEGPNKAQMEGEARQLRETISEEKSKKGAFSKLLEKTKEDHKQQLQALEKQVTEKIKTALADQAGRIRTEVEFEHLQKQAEEQARNCTCSKHAGAPLIPSTRDVGRGEPQASPEERPREIPPTSPRRSRARSPVRRSPIRSPADAPNESPVSRSPSRMPSNAPATSPVRSLPVSPSRPRSPSPDMPRAASPDRPPSRSPSRSPSSSQGRPSEDAPSEPEGRPKKRGPSGLFTNI